MELGPNKEVSACGGPSVSLQLANIIQERVCMDLMDLCGRLWLIYHQNRVHVGDFTVEGMSALDICVRVGVECGGGG